MYRIWLVENSIDALIRSHLVVDSFSVWLCLCVKTIIWSIICSINRRKYEEENVFYSFKVSYLINLIELDCILGYTNNGKFIIFIDMCIERARVTIA